MCKCVGRERRLGFDFASVGRNEWRPGWGESWGEEWEPWWRGLGIPDWLRNFLRSSYLDPCLTDSFLLFISHFKLCSFCLVFLSSLQSVKLIYSFNDYLLGFSWGESSLIPVQLQKKKKKDIVPAVKGVFDVVWQVSTEPVSLVSVSRMIKTYGRAVFIDCILHLPLAVLKPFVIHLSELVRSTAPWFL